MSQKFFLTALGIISALSLLGLPFLFVYKDKQITWAHVSVLGMFFLLSCICFLFSNLSKLEQFKASYKGFEAITRVVEEAETTLQELKELAKSLGSILIEITQSSGRWGGFTPQTRYKIKQNLFDTLQEIRVGNDGLEEVLEAEYEYVCFDYVSSIKKCINLDLFPEEELMKWQSFWDDHSGGIGSHPTPDELERFLESLQIDILDEKLATFLEDYRHYYETKTHRDLERWMKHQQWKDIHREYVANNSD